MLGTKFVRHFGKQSIHSAQAAMILPFTLPDTTKRRCAVLHSGKCSQLSVNVANLNPFNNDCLLY